MWESGFRKAGLGKAPSGQPHPPSAGGLPGAFEESGGEQGVGARRKLGVGEGEVEPPKRSVYSYLLQVTFKSYKIFL